MRSQLEISGHIHPTRTTWILHFSWPTNPLPMNGSRGNWRRHARETAQVRNHAYQLANLAAIPPLGRIRAQLTWWVTTNHVRDPDNLAQLEKPLFDALVSAGIVPDDRPAYMEKPRAVIRTVDKIHGIVTDRCFTLTITQLPEETHYG
ncbi:hypothetical protein [Microbacterium sp. NIBRBAC000506063]|uniref:hypothetical protein n=1 Tax=Microbacterium sp. NIBRBAC000506063 TaxID=2734618 RepID=UPI001BB49F9D|nr:hypothetical protein [Microbacterium sp. NIBRBAC000506063]QTV79456.1 hypothetical protein KAE78_11170 [Microbacterium sp. NIBRBAC000506063]